MQVTYTNIVIIGTKEIPFLELSEEEQKKVSDYLKRTPLETLGTVNETKSA